MPKTLKHVILSEAKNPSLVFPIELN